MKYFLIFFIFLGSINFLFAAEESSKKIELPDNFVSGDSERGSQLVESCSACHGTDGNSISSDWPKLAGQNQKYLYEQLKYFKDGVRMNALMMSVTPYLQTLDDEDLLDIAAFYSNYETSVGQAKNDEELLNVGTQLYRFGNMKKVYLHALLVMRSMVRGIAWPVFQQLRDNRSDTYLQRLKLTDQKKETRANYQK